MTNNKFLILCRNIKIPVEFKSASFHDEKAIQKAKKIYLQKLQNKFGAVEFSVYKKSVDARNNDRIVFVYTVCVVFKEDINILYVKENLPKDLELLEIKCPEFEFSGKTELHRPVVAGFGPSGMFCAYALAKAGLSPIVVERGSDVDTRNEKVDIYWKTGSLDTETNVQFGEGGAGTFSDGKLLTRISDPLSGYVLKLLNKHGAPDEILYLSKPHVGTDLLKKVVKSIRREIVELGGTVMFDSKLTDIKTNSCGEIISVRINDSFDLQCSALFLCIGHSARDTFSLIMKKEIDIKPKPFSVGVRAEHLQSDISNSLYGKYAQCDALEKAQYTLSAKNGKRGVYSFCMCPGGIVVASASDKDEIVTNGMSYYNRDGKNANSAIAVSVELSDFGGTVEGAIGFQKNIEKAAFTLGGNNATAPIQLLGDFLDGNGKLTEPGKVLPTYTGKTSLCDISKVFPDFINDTLRFGFNQFEKNITGFSDRNAVLTAPETRTSSPVRIERSVSGMVSVSCANLYPCGEGAGYAGGITSAAVDGLKCAISYLQSIKEN